MRSEPRAAMFRYAVAPPLALACLALGGLLAWHYPIRPELVLSGYVIWAAVVCWRPATWMFALPALLPVSGFAPWTGWLTFEEMDILVLGAAAGGYAAAAMERNATQDFRNKHAQVSTASLTLIVLFGVSTAWAMHRGFVAAGGFRFGWSQGYYDPLNSLRVFKGFFFATLLAPLAIGEIRRSGKRATDLLSVGLAAGLGLASLTVVWERLAFTELLNFSADYRATGLFWEMHVGGAALDGFLALSAPFAVWALISASTPLRVVPAIALVGLAVYACLSTFSRGVYLALPISLVLLAALLLLQRRKADHRMSVRKLGQWVALIGVGTAASSIVFRSGGYRALLAVMGVFGAALPVAMAARRLPLRMWLAALLAGSIAGVLGAVLSPLVFKGVYVTYAAVGTAVALLIWRQQRSDNERIAFYGVAAFVWLAISGTIVASFWGGEAAFRDSAIVVLGFSAMVFWNAQSSRPLWKDSYRVHMVAVGLVAMSGLAVAVFSGGAYMADRFSTSNRDTVGRIQHWLQGLRMLSEPADWILGKGLGRFPGTYYYEMPGGETYGSYQLSSEADNLFVTLNGPRYGVGQNFRLAQRVRLTRSGSYAVIFDVRAPRPASLVVELCQKHLLYDGTCAKGTVKVTSTGDTWRQTFVTLDLAGSSLGPWYAPRLAFLSLVVENVGHYVQLDNLQVVGPEGSDLIANGDFAAGMARWFSTSDRHHLPWHIKNLALNVLFDQGFVGLALFTMLVGSALWRLVAGGARRHPLAPVLASSLVGYLVIGLFDSLLDVPRLAFLFYLLVLLGLALCEGDEQETTEPAPRVPKELGLPGILRSGSGAQR